ncbi:MAG: ABC transporter ATP-binding protein [Leptolyngbya sp. SIO1E4]|nr:ABC transporter ATP-binding protein [Leptolyngbya sp. SIO1E4]
MTSPAKLPIRPLLWRLITYTPKLALMDAGLWMLISGVFPAIPGLIIQGFFDALTETAPLDLSPLVFLGLLVATSMGEIVAIFAGQWVRTQYRFNLRSLLRHNLLDKLLQQPGAQPLSIDDSQQQTISPGEAIAYFREDPELIEQTIAKTADLIGQGLFALGAIALLLSINARITLIVFLPLAVISIAVQQAQQKIKQYRRASRQATQAVTGFLGEIFAAVQVLKATGTETAALSHLQQINQHRQQQMVKDQLLTTVLNSSFENLINLGIGLILLIVAIASNPAINSLSVGDFALFIYYLAFVTTSFRAFGQYLTGLKQTEVSFDRLSALHSEATATEYSYPQSSSALVLVAHKPLYFAGLLGRQPQLPPIEQPAPDTESYLEELTVVDLSYRHPHSERGIEAISFSLLRGSLTVITGPIGSGKTTLLRVLLGLLPRQAGSIYWNGQTVENPAIFFRPPRSAYTPQVPHLFSNTLRNNLLLGLEKSDAILREVLHLSVFEQDVAAMPTGLATLVGTRGVRLSGGQLQRAAAARMLVRQPELLVFDDLSSALDVETEHRLWERLFKAERPTTGEWQPTCLVTSNRPGVLCRADHIIVLNEGQIEAMGRFDEVSLTTFS